MKKPSDFKIPFTFEDRYPCFIDGLFLVPNYYEKHEKFGKIDFLKKDIFKNNNNPIYIEYCSGNGQWIIDKAKENKNINWIAVEMKFERARQIWVKMHNENVQDNLLVVFGEAYTFSKYYLMKNSISKVYINFPDPWPKEKHAKNRLIQKKFLHQVHNLLIENSKISVVTDDENYSNQIINEVLDTNMFSSLFQSPYYSLDIDEYGDSYFCSLFKGKNKEIRHHLFEKKSG